MFLEIQPAGIDQVVGSVESGDFDVVDHDVGNFAAQLKEIDASLVLTVNRHNGVFVVKQCLEDGSEHLVQSATELDGRLLQEVRRIVHRTLNDPQGLTKELRERRRTREAAADHRIDERLGDLGEKTEHAIRKDFGIKSKASLYLPPGVRL